MKMKEITKMSRMKGGVLDFTKQKNDFKQLKQITRGLGLLHKRGPLRTR
jgi:hypothetical protein